MEYLNKKICIFQGFQDREKYQICKRAHFTLFMTIINYFYVLQDFYYSYNSHARFQPRIFDIRFYKIKKTSVFGKRGRLLNILYYIMTT